MSAEPAGAAEIGMLDTSVFIAEETDRALAEEHLPEAMVISVVTLAELHAGVLAAASVEARATRLATLDGVRDIEVVPVDERAALVWAQLRMELAESGRRINVNDLWIAASAVAHGLPVVTQDADFDPVDGVAGLTVIRV